MVVSAALPVLPTPTKSMVNSLPLVPKVSAWAEGWMLRVNAAKSAATRCDLFMVLCLSGRGLNRRNRRVILNRSTAVEPEKRTTSPPCSPCPPAQGKCQSRQKFPGRPTRNRPDTQGQPQQTHRINRRRVQRRAFPAPLLCGMWRPSSREHGVRRSDTADTDFRKFDFLEVVNPLRAKR